MGWITVAQTEDLKPGASTCVEINEREVGLFNVDGQIYAVDDLCTHSGGPLSEGDVEDGCVTCPWHAARFNLKTGEAMEGPTNGDLQTYEVRIEDTAIQINLPD